MTCIDAVRSRSAENAAMANLSKGTGAELSPAEIETAMTSPASVFAAPEDVLDHGELTREQKIEILRRWQYDEVELDVAVEEGMPGDDSPLLRRIMLALGKLAGPIDLERLGPNKQHGLPRGAAKGDADRRR
jgi:hypothetical protein